MVQPRVGDQKKLSSLAEAARSIKVARTARETTPAK
jgi:hypothetical protein